ncbi:MAG: SDR family oxidoreductase [Acidobacteriota bacterium]|nr:SDR family oxidoreductase [Acidobacteriota bacterium]
MDLGLDGSVALISGSSKGLGLASAKALAAEGARIVLCARGQDTLDAAAAALAREHGDDRVLAVAADVSTPGGASVVMARTIDRFGRIDILVNNVAKAGGTDLLSTTDDEWQAAFDATLFPAIRLSRLAVPHMRRAGGGVILMIASIWGRESGGRMTYNAVKAAEISLAKSMQQQLARDNIRVNSVAPGSILFPGGSWEKRTKDDPEFMRDMIGRDLPFGRLGTAEEVGNLVAFLASPRASWVAGACVTVDGCQSRSNI